MSPSAHPPLDEHLLERAARALRQAEALLIGAGAGMGVDSGLPDFRGNEGFWRAYPPFRQRGLSFARVANPVWFHHDPELAWGFYGHRRNLYRATAPHAGFATLLRWARAKPAGYFVFTSNVDAHFQKAGFDPARVCEIHGSLEHLQCARNCRPDVWPADAAAIELDDATFRARPPLPACRRCGAVARPNVLMFDDGEWQSERTAVRFEAYTRWLGGLGRQRLAIVEIGAGLAVPTVRWECERRRGALLRINPREADTPAGGIALPAGALAVLEALDARLAE